LEYNYHKEMFEEKANEWLFRSREKASSSVAKGADDSFLVDAFDDANRHIEGIRARGNAEVVAEAPKAKAPSGPTKEMFEEKANEW
jgi:hypothetical protein